MKDSYPQKPICYICARGFSAPYSHYALTIDNKRVRKYSGFCTDVDMDRQTYWRNASWWTFYRMILYNPEDQQYHLSGAAQFPFEGRGHYAVPWDKRKGVIGCPKDRSLLVSPMLAEWTDGLEKSATMSGFLVHVLCWKRLSRLIGRDAETHLGTLSRVLRRRPRLKPSNKKIPPGLGFVCQPEQSRDKTAIRELINKSRKRMEQGIEVKVSRLAVKSRITFLPLEIQYHIMDYLGGRDAIRAKQQLRLEPPPSYWRTRIDGMRFYEIDHFPREGHDWEYLCLRLEILGWKYAAHEAFMATFHAIRLQFYQILKKN